MKKETLINFKQLSDFERVLFLNKELKDLKEAYSKSGIKKIVEERDKKLKFADTYIKRLENKLYTLQKTRYNKRKLKGIIKDLRYENKLLKQKLEEYEK